MRVVATQVGGGATTRMWRHEASFSHCKWKGAKGVAAFGPVVKMEESLELAIGQNYNYYSRLTALCPGLPGRGRYQKKHSPTRSRPTTVIKLTAVIRRVVVVCCVGRMPRTT